jgi:hypothetical protein
MWAGTDGWVGIEEAMRAGRLPIIAAIGRNKDDEDEYRFGHMFYQEYLTGRGFYQELTAAQFSMAVLVKLFGDQPLGALLDIKQHLVLQLLADILSPEQLTIFLAVMCGGRVEAPVLMCKLSSNSAMSTRCAVAGCPEAHRNTDGYCHNHREVAQPPHWGTRRCTAATRWRFKRSLGVQRWWRWHRMYILTRQHTLVDARAERGRTRQGQGRRGGARPSAQDEHSSYRIRFLSK